MSAKPNTVEDYLARLRPDQRAALEALRAVIRAAAPEAKECISYDMPTFKLNGMLVGYAAHPNHCALYAGNADTVAAFAAKLAGFEISKGTIRFTPDKPLPADVVHHLVLAKLARNAAKSEKTRA
jgi:uncharacterized protein YdhG (YjbR/CyaY superfamily)